jgi:MFS family permease
VVFLFCMKPPQLKIVLRSLRHRNFRLFFSGQLISLVGTWMQMVAQSWLVYKLTGSSFLLGVVGFASQIPILLLAFVGGAVADRYDRKRVVIGTQTALMILAFILSFLTLTGVVRVWHIIILSVLLGIVNAFDMPVRQAFIVKLVDKEDMLNAIALNSSVFNGARVIGPSIAGVLTAWIGEGWCFFANAVSYIAVIVGLLMMKVKAGEVPEEAHNSKGPKDLLEGFRYARQMPPIRALLLLLALISIVGMPYSVLMPIFADSILKGGARGLGILMGATGLGALAGSILLAFHSGTRGLWKLTALASVGFGVSLILFSVSKLFWLSFLFLIPVGLSFMVQITSSNTLIQMMVPDHLRGRVMSLHVMMFMGMAPFGSLMAGAVAEKTGAPITLAMGGVICLGVAGLFMLRLSRLRQIADTIQKSTNE